MATAAATQTKAKKTAATKKSPSHPTFAEMITDAIVSLKERTGSSQYAITKFIEEKHKALPPTFRKLLLHNLKKSVAAGKLVKVKNSFKLAPKVSSTAASTAKAPAAKPKAVSKPAAPKAASKPKAKAAPAAPKKKATAKPKAKAAGSATAKPKAKAVAAKKVVAKTVKKTPVKKRKSVKSPAKKVAAKKTKK